MGHFASGDAVRRRARVTAAVLVAAFALSVPLLGAAPASATLSSSLKAQIKAVSLFQAHHVGIKHPTLQLVRSTYKAYETAFKGSPKLNLGKVYIVQAIGSFTVAGKSYKSLILFFSTRTGNLEAGLKSLQVKNLSKLGHVIKL